MAVSSTTGNVQATSVSYGCNDGIWQFAFEPKSGLTVQSVSVTSGFASGTLVSAGNNTFTWAPAGGKDHFSNKYRGCALDILVADHSTFTVSLSDGTNETLHASDFVGKFSATNPENCGTCGQVDPIIPSLDASQFCKHNSQGKGSDYHGLLTFENTTASDIVVTIGNMDINGLESMDAYFSLNKAKFQSWTVPAGEAVRLYVDAGRFEKASNGIATYDFSYVYNGQTFNKTVSSDTNGLPPCDGALKDDNPPHVAAGPSA